MWNRSSSESSSTTTKAGDLTRPLRRGFTVAGQRRVLTGLRYLWGAPSQRLEERAS